MTARTEVRFQTQAISKRHGDLASYSGGVLRLSLPATISWRRDGKSCREGNPAGRTAPASPARPPAPPRPARRSARARGPARRRPGPAHHVVRGHALEQRALQPLLARHPDRRRTGSAAPAPGGRVASCAAARRTGRSARWSGSSARPAAARAAVEVARPAVQLAAAGRRPRSSSAAVTEPGRAVAVSGELGDRRRSAGSRSWPSVIRPACRPSSRSCTE